MRTAALKRIEDVQLCEAAEYRVNAALARQLEIAAQPRKAELVVALVWTEFRVGEGGHPLWPASSRPLGHRARDRDGQLDVLGKEGRRPRTLR